MTPAAQLNSFLAKYTPEIAKFARAARAKMLKRLPGAVEMVYDNYNALVIGFGATDRPSEAVFSLAMYPDHVSLCFLRGAIGFSDPKKLLRGGGKQIRHIRLQSPETLDDPAVEDLISQAVAATLWRVEKSGRGQLIIRSISEKQRPRRPKTDK